MKGQIWGFMVLSKHNTEDFKGTAVVKYDVEEYFAYSG